MHRFRTAAIVLAMTAATVGCGGGSGGGGKDPAGSSDTAAATTTVPVPSTSAGTTLSPVSLTLRITDVRLLNSEESDNGMRVLLPSGVGSASVTLTGIPSPNRVISVCQARELDRRLGGASCKTPASGEAVTVTLGSVATGVEIVQVGVSGPGADGNASKVDEVMIRYAASSREINARMPQIAAGDAGGRPVFSLAPPSADGSYRATLTWTVIAVFGGSPSNGQLELVQSGNVTNQAQSGSADVRLSGNVPTAGGDAAIRVQNLGASAMVTPKLAAVLP